MGGAFIGWSQPLEAFLRREAKWAGRPDGERQEGGFFDEAEDR
jgi:hypothetical protein